MKLMYGCYVITNKCCIVYSSYVEEPTVNKNSSPVSKTWIIWMAKPATMTLLMKIYQKLALLFKNKITDTVHS